MAVLVLMSRPMARLLCILVVCAVLPWAGRAAAEEPRAAPAPMVHGFRTTLSPDFKPRLLPPSILATEKEYLATALPIAMAVSHEATYATYWYCEDANDCEFDLAESLADLVAHCESLSLGETCFIHSIGRRRQNEALQYSDVIGHGVAEAEEAVRHGPVDAQGRIFYLPGFSGWDYEKPNFWPRPEDGRISPLLHELNDRGWDVDVVNFLHYGRYMFHDRNGMYARVISDLAARARRQGYRRIAVIGTSRGGSEALRAAVAGAPVDALVLIEPDWQGPKHNRDGTVRENHGEEKARALAALLRQVATPRLALVFFAGSDWFDDISADAMKAALAGFKGARFVLAKPPGYRGHFAAASARFAREFGACIAEFLSGRIDSTDACARPALDPLDPGNWASLADLPQSLEALSGAELRQALKGGGACPYDFRQRRVRTDLACAIFGETTRSFDAVPFARRPTRFVSEVEYNDTGYCKIDLFGAQTTDRGCLATYRSGDFIIFARTDNEAVFVYHYVEGLTPKPARFVCTMGKAGYACAEAR